MAQEEGVDEESVINRRMMMKVGAAGAAVAVAGVATASPAQANGGGKRIYLDVDTNGFADFESPTGDTGPFYVSGKISRKGRSTEIGNFQCWGYIPKVGAGVVNQEFNIYHRGKILISGVESDAPRAVSGGTGDFANARGEGFPDLEKFDFDNSGKFRIKFRLRGASGRSLT